MAIITECPVCEFQGKVDDDQRGKQIECKGCGHKFTVPGPAGPAGTAPKPTPAGTDGTVSTRCPRCGAAGKVPAAARGKKVKCPKCSTPFTVPLLPEPTPPAGGPAAKLTDDGPPQSEAEPSLPDDVGLTPIEEDREEAQVLDDAAIIIDTVCPGCGRPGNVPEKFVGKKTKCPRCSTMFVIKDAARPVEPTAAGKSTGPAKKPAAPAAPEELFGGLAPESATPTVNRFKKQKEGEPAKNERTTAIIAGGAFLVIVLIGLGVIVAMGSKGKSAGKNVAARPEEKVIRPPGASSKQEAPPAEAVKKPPVLPEDKTPPPEIVWVDASKDAAKLDKVRVRLSAVWVDFVKSKAGNSPKKHLLAAVQIENTAALGPVSYVGWGVAPAIAGKSALPVLSDPSGRKYPRNTSTELGFTPAGQLDKAEIMPGQTYDDLLIFEAYSDKVEFLKLELPAVNLGGKGSFGLRIPAAMIMIKPDKEPQPKVEPKEKPQKK